MINVATAPDEYAPSWKQVMDKRTEDAGIAHKEKLSLEIADMVRKYHISNTEVKAMLKKWGVLVTHRQLCGMVTRFEHQLGQDGFDMRKVEKMIGDNHVLTLAERKAIASAPVHTSITIEG